MIFVREILLWGAVIGLLMMVLGLVIAAAVLVVPTLCLLAMVVLWWRALEWVRRCGRVE